MKFLREGLAGVRRDKTPASAAVTVRGGDVDDGTYGGMADEIEHK